MWCLNKGKRKKKDKKKKKLKNNYLEYLGASVSQQDGELL